MLFKLLVLSHTLSLLYILQKQICSSPTKFHNLKFSAIEMICIHIYEIIFIFHLVFCWIWSHGTNAGAPLNKDH
jgi:hypothetical protein